MVKHLHREEEEVEGEFKEVQEQLGSTIQIKEEEEEQQQHAMKASADTFMLLNTTTTSNIDNNSNTSTTTSYNNCVSATFDTDHASVRMEGGAQLSAASVDKGSRRWREECRPPSVQIPQPSQSSTVASDMLQKEPLSRSKSFCYGHSSRSRSTSPKRHSPRIQHTNGRLNLPATKPHGPFGNAIAMDDKTKKAFATLPLATRPEDEEAMEKMLEEMAMEAPPRVGVRRVFSCGSHPEQRQRKTNLQIYNSVGAFDAKFHETCQRNTTALIKAATKDPSKSTSALLAKKALKYRKMLQHLEKLDPEKDDPIMVQISPAHYNTGVSKWSKLLYQQ